MNVRERMLSSRLLVKAEKEPKLMETMNIQCRLLKKVSFVNNAPKADLTEGSGFDADEKNWRILYEEKR